MGQYHVIVNLDTREFLDPHKLGDGLKLMEFGTGSYGAMTALALLLACSNGKGGGDFYTERESWDGVRTPTSQGAAANYHGRPVLDGAALEIVGRWAGCRIAIVGDYADDSDMPSEFEAGLIYSLCCTPAEFEQDQNYYRQEYPDHPLLMKTEADLYRDISDIMRSLLEAEGYVKFSGTGWLTKSFGGV